MATMSIEHEEQAVAPERLAVVAGDLLEASELCAIATMTSAGTPYINTAYFACGSGLRLVWLSHPDAKHSRNIQATGTAALAVYDSTQTWGKPDRGIQVFGAAHEVAGSAADDAESVYAHRFSDYQHRDFGAYRFYVLTPDRMKLFDERELGTGRFVFARASARGELAWETTELYGARHG
jgi:uncharacterized protein YhbP (UPF0306 family)